MLEPHRLPGRWLAGQAIQVRDRGHIRRRIGFGYDHLVPWRGFGVPKVASGVGLFRERARRARDATFRSFGIKVA
jgi:hypothetical protein